MGVDDGCRRRWGAGSQRVGALCGRRGQLEQETAKGGDGAAGDGRRGAREDDGAREQDAVGEGGEDAAGAGGAQPGVVAVGELLSGDVAPAAAGSTYCLRILTFPSLCCHHHHHHAWCVQSSNFLAIFNVKSSLVDSAAQETLLYSSMYIIQVINKCKWR